MDPLKIIQKHYKEGTKLYNLLLTHSELVTKKALEIAAKVPELNPNLKFIEEAAMLHDIGIKFTNFPELYCFGKYEYIEHGYLGRKVLEKENLPRHALVAERHTGVGITIDEIIKKKLPLPHRNMVPLSIEEKIISFADLFYSKSPGYITIEKTIPQIINGIEKHGKDKVETFKQWYKLFNVSFPF